MSATPTATGQVGAVEESGIRPFDIGRDLRPVAELIADAFASELDPRGSAALREMRVMSHIGGLLKLLNRTTGEFNDVFSGFVWTEEGVVVGNITVQRADRFGNRWQIANVAVAPRYRGQGIARRLLQRALEQIQAAHGRWAVLQVYESNAAARHLYEEAGFETLGGRIDLTLHRVPNLPPGTPAPSLPNFRSFSSGQWQELYELAHRQPAAHSTWWRAVRRSDFQVTVEQQMAEWLFHTVGRRRILRRCIQAGHRFDAALVLAAQRWPGRHELKLWVRPDFYGRWEAGLFGWAIYALQEYPRWPVDLSLNSEHGAALEAAAAAGFVKERSLLTMRKEIRD